MQAELSPSSHPQPLAVASAPECTPARLQARIAAGEPVQIIDVREYPEFAAGRIPGAMLRPLSGLPAGAEGLDRAQPVVLVCRTGRRAAMAAGRLEAAGWRQVEVLEGGTTAWAGAGLGLERDRNAPWSLERQVRIAAGALVLAGAGLAVFVHSAFIGLSAFVGAGLIFAGVTDWCGMGLLLAKLPWNRAACSSRQSR
jgi:rhodanese-related sulfurtransferase